MRLTPAPLVEKAPSATPAPTSVSPVMIVPISLYNDVLQQEPAEMQAYLVDAYSSLYQYFFSELREYSCPKIVITVDALHRFSPFLGVKFGWNEERAKEQAMNAGNAWHALLKTVIKKEDNVQLEHWSMSKDAPVVKTNPAFEAAFTISVEGYVRFHEEREIEKARRAEEKEKKAGKKALDTKVAKEKNPADVAQQKRVFSSQFVMEECRVLLEWMIKYKILYIAYLGEPNPAVKYICDHPSEFIMCHEKQEVKIIDTLTNCYKHTEIEMKRILPDYALSQQRDTVFKRLYTGEEFELYDRNGSRLRSMWLWCVKFLKPALEHQAFTSSLTKREAAVMNMRMGILFDAMAAGAAMQVFNKQGVVGAVAEVFSKQGADYYRMAIKALDNAIEIAKKR